MQAREVAGDDERVFSRVQLLPDTGADEAKYLQVQVDDQAGALEQGNELVGRHEAAFRRFPTNERFEAHEAVRRYFHLRLVIGRELPALERVVRGGYQRAFGDVAILHARRV